MRYNAPKLLRFGKALRVTNGSGPAGADISNSLQP